MQRRRRLGRAPRLRPQSEREEKLLLPRELARRCQLLESPRERALARVAGGEQCGELQLVEAPARRLGLGAAALTIDRAQGLQRRTHRGGVGVGLLRQRTWLGLGSLVRNGV